MSDRGVTDEVLAMQSSLEKAITSKSLEEISDIILALSKISMTAEILKVTKIGVTVSKLKKTNDVAKNLVKEWMRIYEASKSTKDSGTKTSSSNSPSTNQSETNTTENASEKASSATTEEEKLKEVEEIDDEMRRHINTLPEGRRKVLEHLKEIIKNTTSSTSIAFALAYVIEDSINKALPYYSDGKAYGAKARTLAFNIKKNERLRMRLIDGVIPPQELVHMSPNDLATDEQRQEREQATKSDIDARRSDYLQVNRTAILQSLGIDPSKGTEFTCRKCKQNKTTHYALQTRSSDEPMTVFVTCLTCSNRWKTN